MDIAEPDRDQLFDALQHAFRRALLKELCEKPGRVHDLDTILETLLSREVIDVPSKELEMRCYHTHLPKLANVGLIAYDWGDGEIEYEGTYPPDRLTELIEQTE